MERGSISEDPGHPTYYSLISIGCLAASHQGNVDVSLSSLLERRRKLSQIRLNYEGCYVGGGSAVTSTFRCL